jgi:FG-GAP-like repeat/FG-GAP repeat
MFTALFHRVRSALHRGRAEGRSRRGRRRRGWPVWLERLDERLLPSFLAPRAFDTGDRPISVAAGDVNGDDIPDLAVANFGYEWFGIPGSVSVLLGNGDGTFQAARNFAAGSGPKSVVLGDANGDGLLDLVTSRTVRVLLGNGDGTFQTTNVSYVAGSAAVGLAMADLDGDGWPDLAVAGGGVSILLNAADDAAFFYLDAPAQVTAGQPFDLTVFALSGTGLLAHGYRGTVAFFATDEAGTLPGPYMFRPEDGGIVSFSGGVTLSTPGAHALVALDLETFTVFGFAFVDVLARFGGGGVPGPVLDLFLTEALAGGRRPVRR